MQKIDSNSVKKEVVVAIALVVFVAGFMAGIIYSAFKTPTVQTQFYDSQLLDPSAQVVQSEQISALEQELVADPENIETMIKLGDIYLDNNLFQEGIDIFSRVEQIEPNNIHVLNDLGTLNMNIGDYDAALTKFKTALEIDPSQSHSLYHIGIIYRDKGEADKALQSFEDVLILNPSAQLLEQVKQEIAALKK